MALIAKRLVNIAASTALLSLVSAAAQAQTPFDVLTGTTSNNRIDATGTSTYKFTGPMILNSIGFVTNGNTPSSLSYTMKGQTYSLITDFTLLDLSAEENGFRWLTISPQSMLANEQVTVTTLFAGNRSYTRSFQTQPSPIVNVSYEGFYDDDQTFLFITNSNIRVSNPGSNVAPEPGSFALALTGGAALIGICIRRRRNAG